MAQMYVIAWRSILTGKTGEGVTEFDLATADAICQQQNREYKGVIDHWPRPVKASTDSKDQYTGLENKPEQS